MSRRRVLLLLKPFDVYPPRPPTSKVVEGPSLSSLAHSPNPKILSFLDGRCRVHKNTVDLCQDVLRRKRLDWEPVLRNNLSRPICNVNIVITIGGDGTLLQASHFLDDSIPVLGVNSDPTQLAEVEEFNDEFDATRSTGALCAATAGNFEQILDEIIEGQTHPSELTRMSINVNHKSLPTYSLNDILLAHPCPATVSRFSFRIRNNNSNNNSLLVNCRSSGLRACTSAGSTAAMLSAGGFTMPISSRELQYMVREPIYPRATGSPLMHGLVEHDQSMHVTWHSKDGAVYIDGSHVLYTMQQGDTIEISNKAPILKVYLPRTL